MRSCRSLKRSRRRASTSVRSGLKSAAYSCQDHADTCTRGSLQSDPALSGTKRVCKDEDGRERVLGLPVRPGLWRR